MSKVKSFFSQLKLKLLKNKQVNKTMSSWMNVGIRVKLLVTFSIVIALFFIGFIISFFQMNKVEDEVRFLENQSARAVMATDITAIFRGKYIAISDYARLGVFDEEQYETYETTLLNILNEFENTMVTEEQQVLFEQIVHNNNRMNRNIDDMLRSFAMNELLMLEMNTLVHVSATAAQELSEIMLLQMQEAGEEASGAVFSTKTIFTIVFIIAFVLGTALFVIISNRMISTIKQIMSMAASISKGNLDISKIEDTSNDELGKLSVYMNKMVENLRELVQQISITSEQVAASSEELTASAEETSSATESISNSIQEVAISSDKQLDSVKNVWESANEISTGMVQIASSIEQVNYVALTSKETSEQGIEVVSKAVNQMKVISDKANITGRIINELSNKSNEIGKIVSVITNVADQTNLLALNAAIEAARAGEHGRGFSVVANEVRNLAEQSRDSAKQIRSLITEIQYDINESATAMSEGKISVEEGITIVDNAGKSFQGIYEAVNGVSSQVQEVSAAVKQITSSAESMLITMDEMEKITENSVNYTKNVTASAQEQNASMQEISASSEALSEMAEELQSSVRRFSL
ncbi:methyl-accepting chemotaxis protein [Evansella sp. AB-rgal1]|uniref:methyl-accepting chemotaxis protein n=1 Tax=Evansella sp. AB-rgal1 TaxID=3242696 RepID=UPI00359E7B66